MNNDFFQINETELAQLQSQWQSLTASFNADQSVAEEIWQALNREYSAPNRAYHNLSHIKALLNRAEKLTDKLQNLSAISFAIWFHDVIYNTRKSDNEEKSAEVATKALAKLAIPGEIIALTREMIMATKAHLAPWPSKDFEAFLDLDLAILGSNPEIYREYSQAIRREYSWVPLFLYRRNRKKILKNFLGRERLFFTDQLRAELEESARINLAAEISSL